MKLSQKEGAATKLVAFVEAGIVKAQYTRSTQLYIPPGLLNRVPALLG